MPVEYLSAPDFGKLELISVAIGLGLLIGLERERAGKEAGLRTFSLVALAGALTAMISLQFAMITLGFVTMLVVVLNLGDLRQGRSLEMTTSAALFVTALNGILIGQGNLFTAVAVTIGMLMLLAWKEEMVGFTRHLSREEVHAGITLLLLALVILPILPNSGVDPWNIVNPRKIWIMVVMISGIGFANYALLRLYGARGVSYTGFLGGLVNSTAAVAELSNQCRNHPELEAYAFRGIMLAKAAMFLRNGLILGLFAPGALPVGLLPVGLMLLVTLGFAAFGGARSGTPSPKIHLSSPFSLRAALEFGLVFLGLTVVSGIGQRVAGDLGFYTVSFFGGMVSSSSTAASAANLVTQGHITALKAGLGVVLTSIASALVLLPIVWRASRGLGRRMVAAAVCIMVAAAAGTVLNPWFMRTLGL
jgi:uncharacterized membrane protein (DUF4010 family)